MTKQRALILLLMVGHLVLALLYANVTPYRSAGTLLVQNATAADIGAPDERQHANYAQHLMRGEGFPVFNPNDPNLYETYQSHQPPLYYMLLSGYARVVGVSDVTVPEGQRLRSLNALIGSLTVWGLFCLGWWGFQRESVAWLTALFGGFLPMMLALSGAISNDPLLICICTWTLACIARALRDGWSFSSAAIVAALLTAGLYTKTSALALFPVVALALYLGRKHLQQPSSLAVLVPIALVAPLVLAAPWLVRNINLYGDPFAIQAFNEAFQGAMQAKTGIERMGLFGYWKAVGEGTTYSFFGVFGYWDIFLEWRVYRFLIIVTIALFIGWITSFWNRDYEKAWPVQTVNVAFFGVVLALFVRFNAQYFQAQARYLYPAIGAIALGMALGTLQFSRGQTRLAVIVVGVLLLAFNLFVLRILPDEFAVRLQPPRTP